MARTTWIVVGVLGAVALLVIGAIGSGIATYNSFVDESVGIDAQSKQVDVQYQRAFNLLPDIEKLADKYIDKTSDAYAKIVAARTNVTRAQTGSLDQKDAAAQEVQTAFTFAVEAYPNIKSDEIYGRVIDETINTQNKIAAEKVRFNDKVGAYNAHRRKCCLPLLVASIMGFDERTFIGYTTGSRPDQVGFPANKTI